MVWVLPVLSKLVLIEVHLVLEHVAIIVNAVLAEVLTSHITALVVILLVSLHALPLFGKA